MTMDIDLLRGWIGRSETASEDLTPALVERYDATLGRPPSGAAAPLLIHLCLTQPAVPAAGLGPDGHPARGGFLPPVPLPRRMWAGGSFEFHRPLRVGSRITRQSTIRDVVPKQGRSGALCFVTVEHRISDPDGDGPAVIERQDIVYRGAQADGSGAAPDPVVQPAETGPHSHTMRPDAPLLFRYSALTFNGHRIHYDRRYTTEVERYPGLIVHGPLQATLLAHLAEDLRGTPPARFSFRSLSPLFDTQDMVLNARDTPQGMALWTMRPGGPVAMQASAQW